MNAISRMAPPPLRWWLRWRKARSEEEDVVYDCIVAQEPAGWLVIEMRWADLRKDGEARVILSWETPANCPAGRW